MEKHDLSVLLIILDGLGDSGSSELGGKTPLESIEQRNLKRFKKAGAVGLIDPISPGVPPGSDTSHLSLFGYDLLTEYPGRGPFEAAGNDINLQEGEIAFRANFATVELKGGMAKVVDRRAGRIPTEITSRLVEVLNKECGQMDDVRFRLYPALEHRAVLVVSGSNLSHQVTDNDPHNNGEPLLKCLPLEEASDKDGAEKMSRLINYWTIKCIKVLDQVEENIERKEQGLLPGNALIVRSPGVMRRMRPFREKWGFEAACVAGGKLYKGIARMIGMDVVEVAGATGMPDTDIEAKIRASLKLLNDHDFVYLHLKGTDVCSHKGDAKGKAEFLERFDESLDAIDTDFLSVNLLAVTGDHSTPCNRAMHSGEPVPLLLAGKYIRSDKVKTFSENSALRGGIGRISGKDLMPLLLDASKRTVELGTRPTPRKLNFIPKDLIPLDLTNFS